MCASNSGNLAIVTWRDHQISSCSKTSFSLGKLRHSAISRVSSISQYTINPCLATLTPWILEILLGGKKYRGSIPVDGQLSGSHRGGSLGERPSHLGLVSGQCHHFAQPPIAEMIFPGPSSESLALNPTQPSCFAHLLL